jgi:WD40 repeat protein
MRLALIVNVFPARLAAGAVGLVALACLARPESLSRGGGPLDRLDPAAIPPGRRPPDPPRELVAVVGQAGGPMGEHPCSITVSRDGQWIAVGTWGGAVRLLAVPSLQPAWECRGHAGPVTALDFAPDGESLASGGADGICRWSAAGAELESGSARVYGRPVHAIAHAPDGRTVATGSEGCVRVWAIDGDGRLNATGELPLPGCPVRALAFHPDGRHLACGGGGDNAVRLLRLQRGVPEQESVPAGPDEFQVRGLAFAPGGAAVASLHSDGGGAVRDAGGAWVGAWRVAGPPCLKAAFAADGRHLLTVHGDGTVWVLRLRRAWWES